MLAFIFYPASVPRMKLTVRASRIIRQMGICHRQQLADRVANGLKISSIKGCGKRTAQELIAWVNGTALPVETSQMPKKSKLPEQESTPHKRGIRLTSTESVFLQAALGMEGVASRLPSELKTHFNRVLKGQLCLTFNSDKTVSLFKTTSTIRSNLS